MQNNPLLSISQACNLLGVHPDTLRRWEKSSKIKSIRVTIASHRRFKFEDIQKLINQQQAPILPQKGVDYPGVSVVYLCHDGNNNILMNLRSKNCRDEHGRWDIGAGGLEFGDSIEDTLIREIKEEYCTRVIDYQFLGYRDLHRTNNGSPTHWTTLDFKVLVDRQSVKNGEPNKFEKIGWFKLGELPSPLHSQLSAFLIKHRAKFI